MSFTERGFVTWGGGDTIPSPHTAKLRYKRFTMAELWPRAGASGFDFAPLAAECDRAQRNGQRLAIRLRGMTGEGIAVPEWFRALGLTRESVTADTNKPIVIPDLTKPEALRLVEAFVHAVAQWIATNYPGLLALLDIGMLGRWGEGHFWGIKGDGTTEGTRFWVPRVAPIEVQQRLVDIHLAAFPTTQLLQLTGPKDQCRYALGKSQAIGWRRDSLGNDSFNDLLKDAAYTKLLLDRAKIAPVMAEFWRGTGDDFSAQAALEQVQRWGVWLVGNGNLGKSWDEYTPAEQTALLAIGEVITARPQPAPGEPPAPVTKPPTVDPVVAALRTEFDAYRTKTDQEIAALKARRFVAETTIKEA